ncbi:hypothetical protein LTR50_002810 [Elasticomyces elasticus]|nr:hypothetical protein LTR50_002810 [Elasticomyces elasticus]
MSPLTLDTVSPQQFNVNDTMLPNLLENVTPYFEMPLGALNALAPWDLSGTPADLQILEATSINDEELDIYYRSVQPAHPFLPPRAQLALLFQRLDLQHLRLAIQYVTATYRWPGSGSAPQQSLDAMLRDRRIKRDGFLVQTLLLYAIELHCEGYKMRAVEILNDAIDLALEIGLPTSDFATEQPCNDGSAVMAESWRRTWWELYVVDSLFAISNQTSEFRCYGKGHDVPLPCTEVEYDSGMIPLPRTLGELDEVAFTYDTSAFSSFAYRIDAARVLGAVFTVARTQHNAQAANIADVRITNWILHLPPGMRECVGTNGKVDEMIFQAHMIINSATIQLHKPLSELDLGIMEGTLACVPAYDMTGLPAHSTSTAKLIHAADKMDDLVTLHVPLNSHTHFFTCALALAAASHLYAFIAPSLHRDRTATKDRIRLCMGALHTCGNTWPLAKQVYDQVKSVAVTLYRSQNTILPRASEADFLRLITEDEDTNDGGLWDASIASG